MAKKKRTTTAPASSAKQDQPATLKDLLSSDILEKLKEQTEALKAEERKKQELKQKQAEEARKAEQKRLDNDFEHLLSKSDPNWRKYK